MCLIACQKKENAVSSEAVNTENVEQTKQAETLQDEDMSNENTEQGSNQYVTVDGVDLDTETDFSKYESKQEVTVGTKADSSKKEAALEKDSEKQIDAAVDNSETGEKTDFNQNATQDSANYQDSWEDSNASGTDGSQKEQSADAKKQEKQDEREEKEEAEKNCTLLIECSTVLANLDKLKEGKESIVPSNGVIYGTRTLTFEQGDTVFDILQREMQSNRIPFEYVATPVYGGNYIEGINNLYEFDCGELSGWMYSVNGVYPNYGCSQYEVKAGDQIVFRYTCDLGNDLGR